MNIDEHDRIVGKINMALLAVLFLVIVMAAGCAPYVGYTHLSDPRINNDGYDLACLGNESEVKRIQFDAAICQNMRGGTYALISAKVAL